MKSGRLFILLPLFLLLATLAKAQDPDSVKPNPGLPKQDSVVKPRPVDTARKLTKPKPQLPKPVPDSVKKDSLVKDSLPTSTVNVAVDSLAVCKVLPSVRLLFPVTLRYPTIYGSMVGGYMKQHERFNVTGAVQRKTALTRQAGNNDWVFYFFCGLLMVVAFVNLAFRKYAVDLFRVFFNTSLRQKQLREQLSQTPLPSLLLNMVFCASGGSFVFFALRHYGIKTGMHPAVELLAISGLIAGIYIGKFVFVNMLGWMFDRKQAAENYLFTVFLVNKVAGLSLIPFTMLLAYVDRPAREVVLTLAFILLVVLVLMRLAKGFLVMSGLRVGLIPYLVFVGAFDIIPALLIYKVLVNFFV